MGTVCDENYPIDPDDEVKKLQDLVKKLEKQNQILKSKQNENEDITNVTKSLTSNGTIGTGLKNSGAIPKISQNENVKSKNKQKHVLDDVDLLDVSDKDNDSEDSWLFASPKSSNSKTVSPYKWVRQDLEKRTPEVENIRKSLVFRLDDVTRMSRSPSGGLFGASPRTATPQSSSQRSLHEDGKPQRRGLSSRENRMNSEDLYAENDDVGSKINTNTFRVKKKPAFSLTSNQNNNDRSYDSPESSPRTQPSPRQTPEYQHNDNVERLRGNMQNMDLRDRNGNGNMSRQSSTDNSIESPRDGEYNKLTDVVDVQVLARMQEDSLRKSMTSPAQFTQKKALSKSINNGYGSNRSSPARYNEHGVSSPIEHMKQSNPSLGSLSSHSDSPSASPYGSNQHLDHSQPAQDSLRRSMPNLAKTMPMSLASHPSDPELNDPPAINTNTFTRRKGSGGSALGRYSSGGLAPRTPAQGLPTYQRTQSPAARSPAPRGSTPQRNASPQRQYNVRNVSPVRTQARNVSPVRTQARNVSPVRTQARNVSPVRTQARNVSPVPTQARNVSPVRTQARNVSPVHTQARNVSPGPASPPVRRRTARNVSPVNGSPQVRNVSPGPGYQDRNASPMRTHQARNVSPVGAPQQRTIGGLKSPQVGAYARTRSPQTPGGLAMPRAYSGSSLQAPSQTLTSPQQRGSSAGAGANRTSAVRSSLPAPKSMGIPRAGSNSKLPSPRKSAIPASRRAALFNNRAGDDWKDGCY